LARYRDRLGGLEQAVHRMTGMSAARFAIPGRGTIAAGMVADVVVFDEHTVIDTGTYADPWQRPLGIHHVIVAGRPAVWHGQLVDTTRGRVLRRGARA
jgi:N-acyl-D-aspartate/D-glutamate deacylase